MDVEQPFFDDIEDEGDIEPAEEEHPIFDDIERGDLAAVQQHVLADGGVLEERDGERRMTPLIHAIYSKKPAIALWLIEHRGQHSLETADRNRCTALHWASCDGLLEVVRALVAAGANPAADDRLCLTPLMCASMEGQTDVVACLLQLPPVQASIHDISYLYGTALSAASSRGHQPIVQLLLDAGADPTVPACPLSPLNQAMSTQHHAIAALLRHAIAEPEYARAIHKARSLLGAGAAALACLRGRVEQGQAMPRLEPIVPQQQQQRRRRRWHPPPEQWNTEEGRERLRATAAFAVGVSGGEKDTGMCEDLYMKLLGYMLPAWADKGPEA